jgi:hypothetical protein
MSSDILNGGVEGGLPPLDGDPRSLDGGPDGGGSYGGPPDEGPPLPPRPDEENRGGPATKGKCVGGAAAVASVSLAPVPLAPWRVKLDARGVESSGSDFNRYPFTMRRAAEGSLTDFRRLRVVSQGSKPDVISGGHRGGLAAVLPKLGPSSAGGKLCFSRNRSPGHMC